MRPTVSIIMPTRGRPTHVERAVTSVLIQSFPDFELLILDNSAQSEKDKIREISSRDPRIIFVERGDIGITQARRLGAVLSRGKLFALLDSDDYWDRDRLRKHVEVWRHNRIGLSWDRWAEVNENGPKAYSQPFSEGLVLPPKLAVRLYNWNFIHASAGIVSSNFARALGFPILDIMSSDWTLFMRAAEYYPAFFIGQTLSFKDTESPERVTNTESEELFRREVAKVTRHYLMDKPGIYGIPYLKRKFSRIRRRIAGRPLTIQERSYGRANRQ